MSGRAGGKKKPLKAPKKETKDLSPEDEEYLRKKKLNDLAEREAKKKLLEKK